MGSGHAALFYFRVWGPAGEASHIRHLKNAGMSLHRETPNKSEVLRSKNHAL